MSGYTEDNVVGQPAIQLMRDELGWVVVNAHGEWGGGVSDLGRESKREVVLVSRLESALRKLNPGLPGVAVAAALEELMLDRSGLGLVEANREIDTLLRGGVTVTFPDREVGGRRTEVVRVIDWDDAGANDFLLVSQFWVSGETYTRRMELVGFVNGLPLVLMELKKPGAEVREAYDKNLTDYKKHVPRIFHYNGFILVSNGVAGKIGSVTSQWEHFGDWKKVAGEEELPVVSLEVLLRGTCEKGRLLDLVENFVCFSDGKSVGKLVARNHQFLGVNRAIVALQRTLTPALSQGERGQEVKHYRGGLPSAGLVGRARELRDKQTPAEEVLWELLRNRQLENAKFRRQHQVGEYICDFYCHEAGLVVECDGEVHDSDDAKAHDKKRDAYLRAQKLNVLRFKNSSVLHKTEEVLTEILRELPSTFGRGAVGEGSTSKNRIGVFLQAQGSGKSYSMMFFAEKVFRKVPGNRTFVIVTDRKELDTQIFRVFGSCGATGEHCQAKGVEDLKRLLTEDHRYVFTLIQKFRTDPGTLHPVLSERDDIVVLTDEAHGSQDDTLAMNLRTALPNAKFLAFTGTPLIEDEERTREIFGDYVSIYDFKQSVDDGATVPLFYENRAPELGIAADDLNGEIHQLITREDRLDKVAKDIVHHFLNRGYQGKAMVVSIDKLTALKMYAKVSTEWEAERERVLVEMEKVHAGGKEFAELNERLRILNRVEKAVVVSPGQNEVAEMEAGGFDIRPHRELMTKEDLEERFRYEDDPFGLVFVCAMWLKGFDAPSCSTIYLDKPMRGRTLMQTIARVNRTHGGKASGLIVDYANVFREPEKALAIDGSWQGGDSMPVKNKSELVETLRIAIEETREFCRRENVELEGVVRESWKHFIPAVNQLVGTDGVKDEFLENAKIVERLYKAVMPDPVIPDLAPVAQVIAELAQAVRANFESTNLLAVMGEVVGLSSRGIVADAGMIAGGETYALDLSQVDFETLRRKFAKSTTRNIQVQQLRVLVAWTLDQSMGWYDSGDDFLDRFQGMVEQHNNGVLNVEGLFERLVGFSEELRSRNTDQ